MPQRAGADDADLPALAHHGDGAGHSKARWLNISAPSARGQAFEGLRRHHAAIPDLEPGASPADFELLQHAEHLIASSIGAASSRLVMSLLLRKRTVSAKAALKLLDDSHAALHFNREILQTALEPCTAGDRRARRRSAVDLFQPAVRRNSRPAAAIWYRLGIPLREDPRIHGCDQPARNFADSRSSLMKKRLTAYTTEGEPYLERLLDRRHMVIEVRANRMPGSGLVITFSDVTPSFEAAEALERSNATLENRVRDRTEQLTRLNSELALAKSTAEDANISKTRFPGCRKPRHPATAERGTALCDEPCRTSEWRRGFTAGREHRRFAGSDRGNPGRTTGYFAIRRRRHDDLDHGSFKIE